MWLRRPSGTGAVSDSKGPLIPRIVRRDVCLDELATDLSQCPSPMSSRWLIEANGGILDNLLHVFAEVMHLGGLGIRANRQS
jgi:hypothetical protein